MAATEPPTPITEPAATLTTELPNPSSTATESVPEAVVVPTTTLSSTVITLSTVTPTVPREPAIGLQVLDEGLSANTYLLNGSDVGAFDLGDDLVVYGEPNPGIEVAIALLKIIGKSTNALTAQALLLHPQFDIRARMRLMAILIIYLKVS